MSAVPTPRGEYLPMQAGDIDAVIEIENDLYPFPWTAGNFHDALLAGYSGWLFMLDGRVAGYAVVMMIVDEAHLLNLSVARERQGEGYGARLLQFVMEVGAAHGARHMLLEVRLSNTRAITLYRQFGFEQIGVRRGYYPAPVGREDALVLRRQIGEISA